MEPAMSVEPVEPTATSVDDYLTTMFNVLTAPRQAFQTLARTRRWLIPIIVCALVSVGYEAVTSRYRMEDMKARISSDPTLSAEEVSRRIDNIEAQRTHGVSSLQLAMGTVLLSSLHAAKVLSLAALLWLAVQIGSNTATFGKLFSMTSFVFLVTVPEQLIKAGLIVAKESYQVHLGPAVFLPVELQSTALFRGLDRLDIFSIWMAILVALGLSVVAGVSKGRAALIVVCLWAFWAMWAMLPFNLIQIS